MPIVSWRTYTSRRFNALPLPGPNCRLWLPGQDDAQSLTIRDRSGNGNHGTITGATWQQSSKGLWALNFATDDYVTVADADNLDIGTADFTIKVWAKAADTAGAYHALLDKGRGYAAGYGLWLSDVGKLYLEVADGSGATTGSSTSAWDDNKWHLFVVPCDRDANATFYVDGTANGTLDISARQLTIANAKALDFGRRGDGVNYLTGQLAVAEISTSLWTASQIAGSFRSERGLFGV